MREKITYIADDGMEFTSEYDCHEYENRNLPWDSVLFYNDCLEHLPTKYDCLGDLFNHAEYAWVRSAAGAKQIFKYLYDDWDFVPPEDYADDQVFAWDADTQDWYDLRERIADLTNALVKIAGPGEEAWS